MALVDIANGSRRVFADTMTRQNRSLSFVPLTQLPTSTFKCEMFFCVVTDNVQTDHTIGCIMYSLQVVNFVCLLVLHRVSDKKGPL